jgi:lipoate---protein ligase
MHQNVDERTRDAEAELAHDRALFDAVETGRADVLSRCWESTSPVVVVGRHGDLAEVHQEACREHHVPIVRRFSGGGAVVLGPGCLNYAVAVSFVSRPEFIDVQAGFAMILAAVVEAVRVPGLRLAGAADLVLDGRKVSGNAQRRGRRALIHHGTLLYDFDSSLASRYLHEPVRQPTYRGRRSHADFIGNLPLDADTLRARLVTAIEHMHNDADVRIHHSSGVARRTAVGRRSTDDVSANRRRHAAAGDGRSI